MESQSYDPSQEELDEQGPQIDEVFLPDENQAGDIDNQQAGGHGGGNG